jgi:hypothetical protein
VDRIDWRSEVVGIDEANFMGPGLVEVAQRLADSGKQVIVAGLDTDYMGRPFAPMPDLLAHAESITKTLAICVRCGNPAKHTQRLRGSDDLIVVAGADMYEARCRRCFEPGIPKQAEMDFVKAKGRNIALASALESLEQPAASASNPAPAAMKMARSFARSMAVSVCAGRSEVNASAGLARW